MKQIDFIGFFLTQDPYRVVDSGELFNSPVKKIIAEELARSDNAVAVFRKYQSRSYVLNGTIKGDSSADLEDAIDQLKLNLLDRIGDMRAEWGSGHRHYESECRNVNIARGPSDVTRCGWSAEFFMPIAFATDGTTQDLITDVSGQTAASSQLGVSNIGTYLALPYITITITAADPNDEEKTITIGNPASSEYLEITDEFQDGDIVTIDCVRKQVFNGATLLNPTGNFPGWAPGGGLLDYLDNFTSRTIDISATYEPRYL